MTTADKDPRGFVEVHGRQADQEVRRMVKVGLVEATFRNVSEEWVTTIHRVTDLGREYLLAFHDKQTQAFDEFAPDSPSSVVEKWKAFFCFGPATSRS